MTKEELRATRQQFMAKMEARLRESSKPEDDVFYHHPDEDHIVLSHVLFWVMSKPFISKMPHHECFLLLHKYEEEMLEAYLTESEDFPELLSYCNIIYNIFPIVMKTYEQSTKSKRLSRKLMMTAVVAAGYGGDIDTELAYDLLDDINFNPLGKVVCPAIERMLPFLNKMVMEEMNLNS